MESFIPWMTRFNASLALSVIFAVSFKSLCKASVSVGFSTVLLKTLFYFIQQVREGKAHKMPFVCIFLEINLQIQSNFFLLLKLQVSWYSLNMAILTNLGLQRDHNFLNLEPHNVIVGFLPGSEFLHEK